MTTNPTIPDYSGLYTDPELNDRFRAAAAHLLGLDDNPLVGYLAPERLTVSPVSEYRRGEVDTGDHSSPGDMAAPMCTDGFFDPPFNHYLRRRCLIIEVPETIPRHVYFSWLESEGVKTELLEGSGDVSFDDVLSFTNSLKSTKIPQYGLVPIDEKRGVPSMAFAHAADPKYRAIIGAAINQGTKTAKIKDYCTGREFSASAAPDFALVSQVAAVHKITDINPVMAEIGKIATTFDNAWGWDEDNIVRMSKTPIGYLGIPLGIVGTIGQVVIVPGILCYGLTLGIRALEDAIERRPKSFVTDRRL